MIYIFKFIVWRRNYFGRWSFGFSFRPMRKIWHSAQMTFPGNIKGHVNTLSLSLSLSLTYSFSRTDRLVHEESAFNLRSFLICLLFILSQQTGLWNFRLDTKFLLEHPKLFLPVVQLTVWSVLSSCHLSLFELINILDHLFVLLLLNVTEQGNKLPLLLNQYIICNIMYNRW